MLGTGEAIVTVMNEKGAPSPVAWTRLRAPQGSMSPTPPEQIARAVAASPLLARYGTPIDRDSAREMLAQKLQAAHLAALAEQEALARAEQQKEQQAAAGKADKKAQAEYDRLMKQTRPPASTRTRAAPRGQKTMLEQVLGSSATKTILNGMVTGIFGTRRRR